ncbi:hypothetical protein NC99_18740 [Sunxiuqinia dokdonensis]|uniref:Uncharacterized protein n=1 Tax=Sunxiuqinia dokdonensis TaxID=1409788 RepID=A0A0L8V9Y3_9BACT|nr:hypothetical protein NC99_18740 [Sunxiuqinia dokdonensis]
MIEQQILGFHLSITNLFFEFQHKKIKSSPFYPPAIQCG